MGTGGFSPEVKRPRREADNSPPASAEFKEIWLYISTPPILLHGIVLNLSSTGTTFTFYLFTIIMFYSNGFLIFHLNVIGRWIPGSKINYF
jgi:hypothetical protein